MTITRRPATKKRNGNGPNQGWRKAARDMTQLTHDNHHTGARYELATFLNDKGAQKALRGLMALQDYLGELPAGGSQIRATIQGHLFHQMKERLRDGKLTQEGYDALMGAL